MTSLVECKVAALATLGYTTGTPTDREWAYLSDLTGRTTGKLNELWAQQLINLGYDPSRGLGPTQIQSWIDMGAPADSNWNEAAIYFWCTLGGVYGPTVRIVPQGEVPTVGFCDYAPAGNCTATRQYLAVDSGFTNPANQWVWSLTSGSASLTNLALWSRDLTNAVWITVNAPDISYDQVGIDGTPNSASLVTKTAPASSVLVRQPVTVPADLNLSVAQVFIKKDTDQTRFPEVQHLIGTQRILYQVNTETGASAIRSPVGTVDLDVELYVDDQGVEWWSCVSSVVNASDASLEITILPAFSTTLGAAENINATGSIIIGNVGVFHDVTLAEVQGTDPIYTTTAQQVSGTAVITAGQGTNTVTVQTQLADADQNFSLKVVATDTVSTDTANKTNDETHYHRENLAVLISELTNDGCTWPAGDPPGCTAQASYTTAITGTPTSIVWEVAEPITGGTAVLLSGQGTGSCVVQTVGSETVGYKLNCNVTSEFQLASDSQSFTQTHAEESTGPAFYALTHDPTTKQLVMQLTGTGVPTVTHTSTLYGKDQDGQYNSYGIDKPVWVGGRYVDEDNVFADVTPGGALIDPLPYLQYYPAAQNELQESNNQFSGFWTKSNTSAVQDQVGLTGEPNTACFLDSTINSGTCTQNITVPDDSNTHSVIMWVKKDTDQTREVGFQFQCNLGTQVFIRGALNTETGAVRVDASAGTVAQEVVDDGLWWKWIISLTNNGTGNTNLIHQIRPNITGNLNGFICGNVQSHLNKSIAEVRGLGPIFTVASAVATDATVYSFDNANFGTNTDGAWYMESEVSATLAEASNQGMLAATNSTNMVFYGIASGGGRWQSRETSNISVREVAIAANTPFKLGNAYSSTDGFHKINVDGTYGSQVAFTAWTTGAFPLKVGDNSASAYGLTAKKYRELQRYDSASLAESETIIDGLMSGP